MKIIEGVYQLLTPFPAFSTEDARRIRVEHEKAPRVMKGLPYVLPYMVKSGGETLLVDCGWNTDAAYEALVESMGEHGAHPSEVSKLAITHVHPDHYGMAGKIKDVAPTAELIIHQLETDVIATRYLKAEGLAHEVADMMEIHGVPPLNAESLSQGSMGMRGNVWAVPADTEVHGGETIKVGDFDFEIIHTPGHTPGHICLYEPNRKALFTGDHILPTITPNVSYHPQSMGNPLGDYMRSMEKLIDLDVEYVLPAHEYDIKDLKKRIREIEDHHHHRLEEMIGCIDAGGSTAWDVAGRVKWTTGMLVDFEPFIQRAAVGETLAHLEYLLELGRVKRALRGDLMYWLPA
ncbi:MAG: MBL fold metallo-hydrolase [Tepidiformaceae bacterium]